MPRPFAITIRRGSESTLKSSSAALASPTAARYGQAAWMPSLIFPLVNRALLRLQTFSWKSRVLCSKIKTSAVSISSINCALVPAPSNSSSLVHHHRHISTTCVQVGASGWRIWMMLKSSSKLKSVLLFHLVAADCRSMLWES